MRVLRKRGSAPGIEALVRAARRRMARPKAAFAPLFPEHVRGLSRLSQPVELNEKVLRAAQGRVVAVGRRVGDEPGGDEAAGERAQRDAGTRERH